MDIQSIRNCLLLFILPFTSLIVIVTKQLINSFKEEKRRLRKTVIIIVMILAEAVYIAYIGMLVYLQLILIFIKHATELG